MYCYVICFRTNNNKKNIFIAFNIFKSFVCIYNYFQNYCGP